MRGVISTVLIFVMLISTFSKTIIFASFRINQEYIAKNLCENRALPEKNCCGKCQLKKQFKNDEQKQDSRLPSSLKSIDEVIFTQDEMKGSLTSSFTGEILFSDHTSSILTAKTSPVFRPPCITC